MVIWVVTQGVIRSFNGLLIIRVKWKAKWKFRHGRHVMYYGKEKAKKKYVDKATRRERFSCTVRLEVKVLLVT